MGLLTVCPFLLLLPFTISMKDDRLPCWWKTACNVACRQVTWFYNRVLYSPRKNRADNQDMVDQFCVNAIEWALKHYENPTNIDDTEHFCDLVIPWLEGNKKLHKYSKGHKKAKTDLMKEYYHQMIVATMVNQCQEKVCQDFCSDGKKQRQNGMRLR